jgi:hypothetical protein
MLARVPGPYEAALKSGYEQARKNLSVRVRPKQFKRRERLIQAFRSYIPRKPWVPEWPLNNSLLGGAITPRYSKEPILGYRAVTVNPCPSIRLIQRIVANEFGITVNALLAHRRTHPLVRCRQIAMWLAKTMTLQSLPEIGRRFANRDHTTVLHAVRKIDALRAADPELEAELERLRKLIDERKR